jgi:class 3 adenylate cyclase/tetratricopeptide (TPR) repeat protein
MTTTVSTATTESQGLLPYVPRLLMRWSPTGDDPRHMCIRGTLAFVDISGFTKLTERLARKGKVGAEEMSDILSATFAGLLTEARADGADLVKWGGDAVLLLFQGPDHALRAARSAYRMRAALRTIGHLSTTSGAVTLRMSMGIHSGDFDFFLVGDPEIHRELLISGPGASITAEFEAAASAGQIGLSPTTVALLPPRLVGAPLGAGRLLRSQPVLDDLVVLPHQSSGIDPQDVLPPPIRAHLLAGNAEPEHRTIAVAFVQFSGTDALLTGEGPVAVAEALDDVVRNVQGACAEHDVTFFETDINRDGGKIMLTAGAPRSSGHDEERMLRVARLVLDRMGRLPLRIGINRGAVFSGDFGPAFRRTYSVKGDAINLAARVMGKAAPGQLLATMAVVDRSRTVFRATELPPFPVKGKSMLIRAAEIGDIVGSRHEDRMDVPLIGRDAEMTVLRSALADVLTRRGRLVEVVGEPGIGKSRLVEELLAGADEVLTVWAPCEEYESSTAYFPFRRLLREVLAVPADAPPELVAQRLVDRVAVNAPHLVEWLPLLGVVMDLEMTPTRATTELDEQFRKGRLEDVVSDFLTWVLPTSSVLVFEDVHLMDDASADLMHRLTTRLDRSPWMVLVTRREQQAGYQPAPSADLVTVRPAPLDGAAARGLVQSALRDHLLPQHALDALASRGGGNPMFLEALVREAGRSGSVADLPESVENLVTSQIDRLEPADRTVLRYAAVLGMVVDEAALLSLLDDHAERPMDGSLDRLTTFLGRERAGRLRFRHALMRDVAYEGLPFRRRRVLHDQVGQTLERSAPTPESQCELLSLHFFHAGRFDKAWTYSVLAGERARAKYANGEAIDFFERAVEAVKWAPGIPPSEVGAVLEQLGDVRDLSGQPSEALDAFRAARRQVGADRVAVAKLSYKQARTHQRMGKIPQSLHVLTRAMHLLDGEDDPDVRVTRSLLATRYASARRTQGRFQEALRWATLAAREAEDAGNKQALAHAYNGLQLVHVTAGRTPELPYGRLALMAYEELGDLSGQGHCLTNLAIEAAHDGSWVEAQDLFQRASRIFHRLGDEANEANAVYNSADVLLRQGKLREAAPLLDEALGMARVVHDEELVALVLRESAQVASDELAFDRADDMLTEAGRTLAALGLEQEVVVVELRRAESLVLRGDLAGGVSHADIATARANTLHATMLMPMVSRVRGFALMAAGSLAEARTELARAVAMSHVPDSRHEIGLALLGLAEITDDPDQAADLVAKSGDLLDPLGVEVTAQWPPRRALV